MDIKTQQVLRAPNSLDPENNLFTIYAKLQSRETIPKHFSLIINEKHQFTYKGRNNKLISDLDHYPKMQKRKGDRFQVLKVSNCQSRWV